MVSTGARGWGLPDGSQEPGGEGCLVGDAGTVGGSYWMKLVRSQLARSMGNTGQSRAGWGSGEHLRTNGHLPPQVGGLTKNPWCYNRFITRCKKFVFLKTWLAFKTNFRNNLCTKFAKTMLVEKPVEKQPLTINVDGMLWPLPSPTDLFLVCFHLLLSGGAGFPNFLSKSIALFLGNKQFLFWASWKWLLFVL